MARSGVRYEDVQRAVDALLAKGEAPSVHKVREVLGTGSFTTISEHLREWRTRREENRDLPPPRGMPEALQELAESLWEKAQASANEALAHYRQEAEGRVEAAKEKADEALRRAEDAEQRESALAAHLSRTEQRLAEQSGELARRETERDVLAEREAKLTARQTRLEAQLASLQQEHERQAQRQQQALSEQASSHQERLAREEKRHESSEARLMGLLDEARQERQAADKQQAQRLGQLEARLERAQQLVQQARAALTDEEKRHRETEWARHQAEERTRTLLHEQALMQARIDEQKQLLEEQVRRLRDLEAQLHRCLWQAPVLARPHEEVPENDEGPSGAGPSGAG
ncbi:DNA-binding protein [Halomonas ventosae]|uniref:Plasmid replication DNA-binding protein KfrA n=2 Tax=Halomonas TaxID=2745 RepID=A0A4R6HXI1_9GAMM|nr:DNA-binding protein [Halomonas ventosae]TDO13832.1 plasmid replication DNA-binding protein KfrA [Halomonas ventosae]